MNKVKGIRLAAIAAGIKQNGKEDLVLIECGKNSHVSGVFTRNAFCAAPVIVAKKHLETAPTRYLLINSGNANAGTGEQGLQAAEQSCQALAALEHVQPQQVLPFSTNVIGQQLPVEKIEQALPDLIARLDENNWDEAAKGIMTTDTVAKKVSETITVDGQTITINGICKGAGMIQPNMATMLAYIATDAQIEQSDLDVLLNKAVAQSFNRITVDGDTSTNDACILIATGETIKLDSQHPGWQDFEQKLIEVLKTLAQMIIRDAEGASKFITIEVKQGFDEQECLQVAYTVAHSPLVKTAFYASDANWGRILAAVGRSGLKNLDISKVSLYLDNVCLIRDGQPDPNYSEEAGQAVMQQHDIRVAIELGRGQASQTVWTSDLSHEYVTINAEYRT